MKLKDKSNDILKSLMGNLSNGSITNNNAFDGLHMRNLENRQLNLKKQFLNLMVQCTPFILTGSIYAEYWFLFKLEIFYFR